MIKVILIIMLIKMMIAIDCMFSDVYVSLKYGKVEITRSW